MGYQHWNYNQFNARDSAGSSNASPGTALKAAPGAGMSIYVTDILLTGGATGATFTLTDGSGGTVLWRMQIAANGSMNFEMTTPLKCTVNTALYWFNTGASAGAFLGVNGFVGKS